jgi:hypothetical protein
MTMSALLSIRRNEQEIREPLLFWTQCWLSYAETCSDKPSLEAVHTPSLVTASRLACSSTLHSPSHFVVTAFLFIEQFYSDILGNDIDNTMSGTSLIFQQFKASRIYLNLTSSFTLPNYTFPPRKKKQERAVWRQFEIIEGITIEKSVLE